MDGYSGTPPTPPYTFAPAGSSAGSMRPPLAPSSAAATGNPSGPLARGLFAAPRTAGAQPNFATGAIPPQRQKKAANKRPVAAAAAVQQKKGRKAIAPPKVPRAPLHQAPAAHFNFPAPQPALPQVEYINMMRDQILAQKRMSMGGMGGMGGMEGFGGMGGYGAPPTSSDYGGMGDMNVAPGGFMATMMNMGGMGVTGDAQAHVDEHAQGQVDEGKEDGEEK